MNNQVQGGCVSSGGLQHRVAIAMTSTHRKTPTGGSQHARAHRHAPHTDTRNHGFHTAKSWSPRQQRHATLFRGVTKREAIREKSPEAEERRGPERWSETCHQWQVKGKKKNRKEEESAPPSELLIGEVERRHTGRVRGGHPPGWAARQGHIL